MTWGTLRVYSCRGKKRTVDPNPFDLKPHKKEYYKLFVDPSKTFTSP